jgi:hypothetical protein
MTIRRPSIHWPVVCFLLSMLLAVQALEATVIEEFRCQSTRYIAGSPHRCLCFNAVVHPTDTCHKWIPTAATSYQVRDITCEADPGQECNYVPWTYSCGDVYNCPGFQDSCSDYANMEDTDATTVASWNCVHADKGSCGIAYGYCSLP